MPHSLKTPDGNNIMTPITHETGGITTFSDRDPFHYEFSDLKKLGEKFSLDAHYIGDWDHPRNQKIMYYSPKL